MALSFVDEHVGWIGNNYGEILRTDDGGTTWSPQTSGTAYGITAMQCLDTQEGWATATNRVILHTTDGGNNWSTKILDTLNYGDGVTAIYSSVFFYGRSRGWIGTVVLSNIFMNLLAPVVRTLDKGKTWAVRGSPAEMMINSIKFVGENTGWAATWGGILRTTNGGDSWTYDSRLAGEIIIDLWFADSSTGWALSFTGNIYRYQSSY